MSEITRQIQTHFYAAIERKLRELVESGVVLERMTLQHHAADGPWRSVIVVDGQPVAEFKIVCHVGGPE